MLTSIRLSNVFVLDQEEALRFYVGKLGLEVRTDADLGFMRWLTVTVPASRSAKSSSSGRGRRRWTTLPPNSCASS